MTHNLSVRRRLLYLVLTATVPFVLAIILSGGFLGLRIWRDSMAAMESRTVTLQTAIETSLREAIVTYLRSKTETAVAMAELVDNDGVGSVSSIRDHLLAFRVAVSGYVYVIDSDGAVVIHPDPRTEGRVIPQVEPVRTQLEQRRGYLEYMWQNSFEPLLLPKALYMEEYPQRGWIVAATAYRDEFVDLIDRDRLANLVEPFNIGPESYSVVIDREGEFVVHPEHRGRNLTEFFEPAEANRIYRELFVGQSGPVQYSWPDPRGNTRREKLLVFRYMPDFDWVIATTIDIASVRRPIVLFLSGALVLSLILLLVVIRLSLRLARSVSDPIVHLVNLVESDAPTALPAGDGRMPRELIVLTEGMNAFIDRIREQQAVLQQSVHEKNILIREIHHRVKNNLQVIASLLNLQSGEVMHPADAELFERSHDRVISIALVHEQLYQNDSLSMIPFDRYLQDLVGHIRNAVQTDGITIRLDVESCSLGIDLAAPCGLIVSELITNALKHAFPRGGPGTIDVRFRLQEGYYQLEVADTGEGMTDGSSTSLGMTLIRTLAEQIGGTMDISGTDGTTIRISFPHRSG
jgi:two-component sensor histidine kinase